MTNYVPFSADQIDSVLSADMGFHPVAMPLGSNEIIYERGITTTSGATFPYTIRVYTSVSKNTGWTKDCGTDAIRVVLIDNVTGKPALGAQKRVHRTKSAMTNLRKRCRTVFKTVLTAYRCPKCGAMMRERTNRKTGHSFLGCSRYAPGAPYHCTGHKQEVFDASCV